MNVNRSKHLLLLPLTAAALEPAHLFNQYSHSQSFPSSLLPPFRMRKYTTAGPPLARLRIIANQTNAYRLTPPAAKSIGTSRIAPSRLVAPAHVPTSAPRPKSSASHELPPPAHNESQLSVAAAADKVHGDNSRVRDGSTGAASALDDRAMGELAHMRLLVKRLHAS
jgi:hypothetical protein